MDTAAEAPADEHVVDTQSPDAAEVDGRSRTTIGTVIALLAVAWGAGISSYPLTDNSFLTHLATGRLILERGSVPSTDPYTFTARGTEWTVQSWLASVAYASAERVGGVVGLRVLVLAVFVVAAALLWRLSRPCRSLVPRIAIVFGSLYVVTSLWGERPYMVGVIGLGLVWLALDGAFHPGWLIPLFWVWANSHGSFPLGLVLIGAVLVGRRLDGVPTDVARRVLMFAALGTVAAVVGPLGPKVLLFPLTALTASDVLTEVVEWQPASYRSWDQRLFLVLAFGALLGLVRRPQWRLALPTILFVAAAVVAQRNLVMALMVLVPVLAETMPTVGVLTVDLRPNLQRAYLLVGGAALVAACLFALASPFGALGQYPGRPLVWLADAPVSDQRTATQDIVGNLLEVLDGEDAQVFVDDRVDMLPPEIVYDGLSLLRAEPDWSSVLADHDIDVVVWERSRPLASLLAADDSWRIAFSDSEWTLACRRASAACDSL